MMQEKPATTPLMKQYFAIKEQHPHALLLFQVGDFYELFFEDAKKAASCLAIALTTRGKHLNEEIPLCGVPVHAIEYYLTKLVKAGFNVALCNQLEEAVPGKVVDRGVTQVFTPGTLTDAKLLDEKSASYLLSFFPTPNAIGLLFGELLTGQLHATTITQHMQTVVDAELTRFFPDEIIVPETQIGKKFQSYFAKMGYCSTFSSYNTQNTFNAWLQQQFNADKVQFLQQSESLRFSFSLLYEYLKKNQEPALEHFKQLHFYKPDDFLQLDAATQRNLELVRNNQDGSRKNTLFETLDGAATPMGSRTIKKWITQPSVIKDTITQRQDTIQTFVSEPVLLQKLKLELAKIGDVERVVGRIALGRASVNDYAMLSQVLGRVPRIKQLISNTSPIPLLELVSSYLDDFHELQQLLAAALETDTGSEWIIKKGFDQRLDELRTLVEHSNDKILELERKEQLQTTINSLKIRYNQVQGYYIEVTKPNVHLVPAHYMRHQTLVGKERYTTQELKNLESALRAARAEIDMAQKEVFERVKAEVARFGTPLRKMAQALGQLDALVGFSCIAYERHYVRPTFNDQRVLKISQGRHPVVEQHVGHNFIPNDTLLDDQQSLLIITGPNMGGKSTYLRQVALNALMAQCGSFVPAASADCFLLDRIFTRIGAGDNVAEGKSTFLVEMEETAAICNQATKNSLVILDEVGRGTSTFDGLSIAQAVVEYIFTHIGARCLFATHYHELTALQKTYTGIKSYYAASSKTETGIILLYKILQGVADGSFGIEVAKLAQLPKPVVQRAQEIAQNLNSLQPKNQQLFIPGISAQKQSHETAKLQKTIFDLEKKLSLLRDIDFDELSPKKAFDILWKLKEMN